MGWRLWSSIIKAGPADVNDRRQAFHFTSNLRHGSGEAQNGLGHSAAGAAKGPAFTYCHSAVRGPNFFVARRARVECAEAMYHVMDRRDRQETTCRSDEDRVLFLRTLGQACERTGWRVHSHVLMGNHYHMLLETPEPSLCAGMRWMQGDYTIRHNARHRLRGHLFQGCYKAVLVGGGDETCFGTVSDYIHLNPARAGRPGEEGMLADYRWSSFPGLTGDPRKRPDWLMTTGLAAVGPRAEDLANTPKSDPRRISMAAVVKGRTIVGHERIARRVHMGAAGRVSRYCSEAGASGRWCG